MYFSGINPIKAFLKDPVFSKYYFVNSLIRVAYTKCTNKRLRLKWYAGRRVLDVQTANDILKEKIIQGESFMVGRFGSVELGYINEVLMYRKGIKDEINISKLQKSCINCGFFPATVDSFEKFTDIMLDSCAQIDVFGTFRMIQEDYYIKYYMKDNVLLTNLNMMDFWRYEIPFTTALKYKKVLIIHPLAKLIKNQYLVRDRVHGKKEVLPDFELKILAAVQTSGGNKDYRFKDWFEALDYMYKEAMKIDFEIAIIGCGAYGLPLAAKLKKKGKSAIVMGGVTQMLFGIKGKRWDNDSVASKLYNEYWVRPDASEVPKRAKEVEDGSYW